MANPKVLLKLYNSQQGKCYYCKRKMIDFEKRKKLRYRHEHLCPSFDHIILKSEGGFAVFENGVCACKQCNGTRATINFEAFRVLVQSAEDILVQHSRKPKKVRKSANQKYNTYCQLEFHKNPHLI